MIILGFDPGGKNRNAVAILRNEKQSLLVESASVESAARAIEWFAARCPSPIPTGLGIDTLLHWSLSESGWRPADRLLRQAYPEQAHSVLPMNSIYGSMLGQGMALAIAARSMWPDLKLNEVHPKILHSELFKSRYERANSENASAFRGECLKRLDVQLIEGDLHSEDQFDAIVCCLATFLGLSCGWVDLIMTSDRQQLVFPISNVSHYWPRGF